MTHRARSRVHLITGGPNWEQRRAEKETLDVPRKKLPKKQRAALKQLDTSLAGLRVALRHRQLTLARQLRSAAWDEVEKLPAHLTRDQRRDLWQYKQQIATLAALHRRRPQLRPPGKETAKGL